jgi:hypothetical protein
MKNLVVILSFSLLFTSLSAKNMNIRSFAGENTQTADECCETPSGGGGGGLVILANKEGLQIMDVAPGSIHNGTSFMAAVASGEMESAEMEVTTPDGHLVWKSQTVIAKGYNALRFKVQNLSKGIYFLKIKTGGGTDTKSFLVK